MQTTFGPPEIVIGLEFELLHLHIYADHPCRGHRYTPIPSQRLVFEICGGNSLDYLFHLWHIESHVRFFLNQAEMWTPLTREHVSIVFWPISENSVAFLHKINICLPLCKIQVAFLDAVTDCVE